MQTSWLLSPISASPMREKAAIMEAKKEESVSNMTGKRLKHARPKYIQSAFTSRHEWCKRVDMSKPVTAVTHPVEVALEAGQTYYWCTCGRSRRQPFCDGSHQGTGFSPLAFKAERSERRWLCQCKRTGTPPFCDGSHDRLFPETVEKTFPEKPSVQPTAEEPTLQRIHHLARHGLEEEPQGELAAMGVPRTALPGWEDIQILTA